MKLSHTNTSYKHSVSLDSGQTKQQAIIDTRNRSEVLCEINFLNACSFLEDVHEGDDLMYRPWVGKAFESVFSGLEWLENSAQELCAECKRQKAYI